MSSGSDCAQKSYSRRWLDGIGRALGLPPFVPDQRILPAAFVFAVVFATSLTRVGDAYLPWSIALLILLSLLAAHDFFTLRLPNLLTLALAAIGALLLATRDVDVVTLHASGAILVAFAMHLIGEIFARVRGIAGLGFGDVKLAAASCLWLGPLDMLSALFIACVSALAFAAVVRRPALLSAVIPFGTFICLGVWITWVFGPWQDWI